MVQIDRPLDLDHQFYVVEIAVEIHVGLCECTAVHLTRVAGMRKSFGLSPHKRFEFQRVGFSDDWAEVELVVRASVGTALLIVPIVDDVRAV
ncbi:MAG: hypothetical protein AAGH83_00620 [Pseudomonadota bacterium]